MSRCSTCGTGCSGLGSCSSCGRTLCYLCAEFPEGLLKDSYCEKCLGVETVAVLGLILELDSTLSFLKLGDLEQIIREARTPIGKSRGIRFGYRGEIIPLRVSIEEKKGISIWRETQ